MASSYFVTGGTGFIGRNLIARLLTQHPQATINLLVRAEDDHQAEHRVAQLVNDLKQWDQISGAGRRLRPIIGDVTLPDCGIDPESWAALLQQTSHIIHGAAALRFDLTLEQTRAVNLEGTRHVLKLAQACDQQGRLERFVYVGTSSVSGMREGLILESELQMGQHFFNSYEQSKYETELLLRRQMAELPITVFRPSIVIGDSRTGRTTLFNVIYYPLRFIRDGLLTFVPGHPDTLLDLVPVDWVVEAMTHIMGQSDSAGQTYHLTAGLARAAKLGHLLDHAVAYLDAHSPLDRPRRVDIVSAAEYQRRVGQLTGRAAELYLKMGLLFGYVSVNRLFDTTNTDAALSDSDLDFPPYETYADRILAYCLLTDWGKQPD